MKSASAAPWEQNRTMQVGHFAARYSNARVHTPMSAQETPGLSLCAGVVGGPRPGFGLADRGPPPPLCDQTGVVRKSLAVSGVSPFTRIWLSNEPLSSKSIERSVFIPWTACV